MCASVTCSNGTGSGIIVPGTGVHVNNMLGEEDLNPGGFHRIPRGPPRQLDDGPDVALRDGEVVLGLGSAGSNRIRSAILDVAVRVLEQGMDAAEAVRSPRIHFEDGTVQAEPGVDEDGLARDRGAAGSRSSAGRARTSTSAASRRSSGTRRRASSRAEATHAGGGRRERSQGRAFEWLLAAA